MLGSKLQLLSWCLPLTVAAVFAFRLNPTHPILNALRAPASEIAPAQSTTEPILVPIESEVAAFDRLRAEISTLQERISQRDTQLATSLTNREDSTPAPRPALNEAFLEPAQWTDAGAAAPLPAVETLLWSGANGDLARMASLLEIEPDAQASAQVFWDRLPPDLKPVGSSPQDLVALLATATVPLAPVKLVGDFPLPRGEHSLVLQVRAPAAESDAPPPAPRFTKLNARQSSAGGDWRIVVTPETIETLITRLETPAGP